MRNEGGDGGNGTIGVPGSKLALAEHSPKATAIVRIKDCFIAFNDGHLAAGRQTRCSTRTFMQKYNTASPQNHTWNWGGLYANWGHVPPQFGHRRMIASPSLIA
jgi:hypothetical protein